MSNTAFTVIGLITWSVLLSFMLVNVRLIALRDGRPLNSFDPAGRDLQNFGYRVTRAHANSLDNLAIPVGLLLYAIATEQTAITEGLASWVLFARIAQSTVHMISTSVPMVLARATFFSAQLIICVIWAWRFWQG